MKGILFLKPLEYKIEVIGEQWRQGDKIHGALEVTNHGKDQIDLQKIGVTLARGQFKKLKNDTCEGLKDFPDPVFFAPAGLASTKSQTLQWSFELENDCLITDKKESLYIRFGQLHDGTQSKFLQLPVIPRPIIDFYLDTFVNFFRFKSKEKKNAKKCIEAVMIPPQSRELSNIDSLSCFIAESAEGLSIDYQFKIKKLQYAGANVSDVKLEKETRELSQKFSKREYLMFGDTPNQDFFIKKIQEALDNVRSKLM